RAPASPVSVAPGLHGLSNHLLDTGWPKVRRLRQRIERALDSDAPEKPLFEALADAEPAPDDQLPATGVELARERLLSPARIRADGYGTRASTLVLVDHQGRVEFVERSWSPLSDTPVREKSASFEFDAAAPCHGPTAA
ncbi:MAG TPA: NRDE family protein, partial [Burkholderiaceae bacterium]|nr:NRDE family protein [Burkholderiaceae bacterium]